jgi:hypothetical protein
LVSFIFHSINGVQLFSVFSKFPEQPSLATNLLAARPVLDRRSSHTGVVTAYGAASGGRRVSHTVGLSPRSSHAGQLLNVPHARSR